jgi:hypothetical protein
MQKTTTAILAISIAAITVSFIAANGMLPTTFMVAQSNHPPSISDKSGMLGHVTYVVRGPDGNIKAYAQTDNTRTVQGINCAQQILFNTNNGQALNTNGTNVCSGMNIRGSSGFNGFNVIGLVNGSTTSAITLNGSDTATLSKIGGTRASSKGGLILTATANEGGPKIGTVAGTSTYNQITITSPAFAFSNLASAGTNIRGSFLMNNTSSTDTLDATFAENTFSGGGVAVGNGDTLTVTWTITLT